MKSGLEIEAKEQFLIGLGWHRSSSGLCLISNGSVKKFREQSGLGGVYGDLLHLSLINREKNWSTQNLWTNLVMRVYVCF